MHAGTNYTRQYKSGFAVRFPRGKCLHVFYLTYDLHVVVAGQRLLKKFMPLLVWINRQLQTRIRLIDYVDTWYI